MFKLLLLKIFTFTSILVVTDSLIRGFDFDVYVTLITFSFILSFSMLIVGPILKFLTLPFNKFSIFLFNIFLVSIMAYFYNIFIPGFNLSDGYIGPFQSSFYNVPEIEMVLVANLIFASFLIALLNVLVDWCISKD